MNEVPAPVGSYIAQLLQSVYGIWNLNFFQFLFPPFCLDPRLGTIEIIALDYMTAFYPLFLTLISYIIIELYGHNFKPLVLLWRPFRRLFIRFHKKINVKNSILDVFATFLLLSYVKILYVSSDLLHYSVPRTPTGEARLPIFYYDGTIGFFRGKHIGYGILAIIISLVFIFLPFLFLLLYPCKFFHKGMMTRLNKPQIRQIVDRFQGQYKDGTDGTRDYRYFSAIYLLCRISGIIMTVFIVAGTGYSVPLGGILATVFAMSIFICKPYKKDAHNSCNGMIISLMAIWLLTRTLYRFPIANVKHYHTFAVILDLLLCFLPIVYFICLVVRYARSHFKFTTLKTKCKFCCFREKKEMEEQSNERQYSFADRILNPSKYNLRTPPAYLNQSAHVPEGSPNEKEPTPNEEEPQIVHVEPINTQTQFSSC